ncbi:ABC transporter ATP-binding protein [Clostridium sp. AN503]|uniref:ABC transporter ATP-binding protein n=1 Tax=Clostridium sp. AN503 TaxID=3160598 RepID=UPI0034577CC5
METPSKPQTKTPIIQVKNLYKIYKVGTNKVYALNGVDFTMYKGEFCAIVGPSGSGKSTLLNMLAGLEKPSKGEIVIAGKHMEKMNENQLVAFRRENVGFIFQSYNLLQTLNAVENVALPLSFRGIPRRIRNERAKKYLKLVGLEKQMKHMANAMSGGQQQRVGIARALVVNPKIIFADEPTGNLDSKTTMEVLKLMRRIVREQNQTLVMVTHDNHLATFADRQFHIVDGKILKIEEQYHPDDEDFTPEAFLEAELHTQPPESPDTPAEPDSGSTPDNQLTEA